MKSIEKPLTVALFVAFVLLVYFFQCKPSYEANLATEQNQPEEVMEVVEEVMETDSNAVDSNVIEEAVEEESVDEEEPYFKSIREDS